MDAAVAQELIDRRCTPRRYLAEEHGIVLARVRPGHTAVIVDVSTRGALIETGHRALPGTLIELHVQRELGGATVRGRVTRCTVVCVHAAAVRYRAALAFESDLPGLG